MTRFVLILALVTLSYVAGLLVTGRMQTLEPGESDVPTPVALPTAQARQAPRAMPSNLPDFTEVAARTIEGVTQHLCRPGRAPTQLAVRKRSVLQIFLRRRF